MNNSADYIYDDTRVSAIAWSPDASRIATAADTTLMGWGLREEAGQVKGERFLVVPHEAPVSDVAFSNAGQLLASASENVITVRSAEASWNEVARVEHASAITSLEFCSSDEIETCWNPLLAYGMANGDVGVLDLTTKKQVLKTVHKGRVNSVRCMGFAHTTLVSAGADRRIVESSISNLEQMNRRRAPSELLSTPYRPNGVNKQYPSMLRNDDKVGRVYGRRLDALKIGASYVSAGRRTIEYGIAEGQLDALDTLDRVSSLSWLSSYPFNYATGDKYGEVSLYGIHLRHRPAFLDNLVRWIAPSNVLVDMDAIVSVQAHRSGKEVTAIAYPAIQRSESVLGGHWLMATGAADGTVKFWDINSLRSSISYEGTRRFPTRLGIGDLIGLSRNTIIRVRPEEILRGSLSGVSARRKK